MVSNPTTWVVVSSAICSSVKPATWVVVKLPSFVVVRTASTVLVMWPTFDAESPRSCVDVRASHWSVDSALRSSADRAATCVDVKLAICSGLSEAI